MSNIRSITKKKIQNETLWNLAVEKDESYIANDIVVHNCRSTLIPITKYEEFKPTESIRGMSPDKFIEENKGQGFSKYTKEIINNFNNYYEPKVGDEGVEFDTEIISENQESIKYYYKGLFFKETIITYGTPERIKGDYISIKHKKVLKNEK